ncbi:hypothetical protein [Pseudomonas sp. GV071]|uniref:hypothetical protein n=1 Tax=Pseudomonas sp. GV071 TaxID=2135754 RepID=UPI000D3B4141|nr:hypothetical protein [Pseudomonas sp. GV071]PTQ74274.1 hypothetical protein C8K61_101714 [Pseudomonas sp. GV071]
MPAFLFHQNMRTLGPALPWRIHAYGGGAVPLVPMVMPAGANPIGAFGAFGQIAAGLAPGSNIIVAGLTEMASPGVLGSLPMFNQALAGGGIHRQLLVACGSTALARGRQEYTALLFKVAGPGIRIRVLEVGRISLTVSGNASSVAVDRAPAAPPVGPRPWAAWQAWAQTFPAATSDFRALVYAVVQVPGVGTIGVAYLHNMYTLDAERNLMAGKLAQMMSSLKVRVGRLAPAGNPNNVYLGGDFNVEPTNRRGGVRSLELHVYDSVAFPLYHSQPNGTTWNGRLYDYWYSDVPPPVLPAILPRASANNLTRDCGRGAQDCWELMSDHSAILLEIG